ncbi:MAG: MTAP family purine nucleoside phosphorylase [Nitrososphaerota archaeon]|nr:MTAP family purine nucleoside phosphorylase [Nitrososphaerota archaeon]MDG6983448.1 MTAP family purine nucleoside phosphorylase [Nitrososphaerota archaeon]
MTRDRPPVGVITGTGVTEHFELSGPKTVRTRYGTAVVYPHPEEGYVIIARHGAAHKSPPHGINYKANIAAFEQLGVKEVVATSAVGSMNQGFRVGAVGLIEQFLDFTKRRQTTFFEDKVVHTDMTYPYSRHINLELSVAAKKMGLDLHQHLVYVCAEGPRFETAAEIKMYKILGGDVVGMTGVPEVVLANEKGIGYASVVIATNWAAGMQAKVSHGEVLKVMKMSGRTVRQLIEDTVAGLRGEKR